VQDKTRSCEREEGAEEVPKMHVPKRIVDSDSLNPGTDPDPAFQLNLDPIRIQGFYDQN
jgi:hypothetical protein